MKIKRKLIPYTASQIGEIESWLCENAEKGLFYKSSGALFAEFELGEPCGRRYRLEYTDKIGTEQEEDRLKFYEQLGWTACDRIKTNLMVLYTDDESAQELHNDERELEVPLRRLAKKQTQLAIAFLVLFLFMPTYLSAETPLISILNIGTVLAFLISLASLLMLCECIFRFRRAHIAKKNAALLRESGELPKASAKLRGLSSFLVNITVPLIITFFVLWFAFANRCGAFLSYCEEPISDMPFLTYEDLTNEKAQSEEHITSFINDSSDILAPKVYNLSQVGSNDMPTYDVEYYCFSSESLARQYEQELIKSYTEIDRSWSMLSWYYNIKSREGTKAANDFARNLIPDYDVRSFALDGASVTILQELPIAGADNDSVKQLMVIRYKNKVESVSCYGSVDIYARAQDYIKLLK